MDKLLQIRTYLFHLQCFFRSQIRKKSWVQKKLTTTDCIIFWIKELNTPQILKEKNSY
jgi:hypothetical protein